MEEEAFMADAEEAWRNVTAPVVTWRDEREGHREWMRLTLRAWREVADGRRAGRRTACAKGASSQSESRGEKCESPRESGENTETEREGWRGQRSHRHVVGSDRLTFLELRVAPEKGGYL